MISENNADHPFLFGGGEAADIIAAFDWSATSLGPIENWPQSLKSNISLILRSPVPIVTLWDEDGYMIYNDAYSVFAGGRHPQLFGSKVREGWPEVADFNDNVMKVGLSGGTLAYRNQVLVLSRHGEPEQVWLNLDYSPLLDEAGKPAGVMAVVVEITDKIRAERELAAERESLRQLFAQAPGFIAATEGGEHRFVMANQAYPRLVAGRDVVGRTVADALPEVVDQGFTSLLDGVYTTGVPYIGKTMKVDLLGPDGASTEERYLDFIYQPVVSEDGITGVFIQGHDVTEEKRIELALRESEERFRLVAETAPVMLWMGDRDGKCVYLNKAQREFWGVSRDEVPTFDWFTTIHPDDLGCLFFIALRAHRHHRLLHRKTNDIA